MPPFRPDKALLATPVPNLHLRRRRGKAQWRQAHRNARARHMRRRGPRTHLSFHEQPVDPAAH
eukprot:15435610-Alexandrium_andersonii.AAC.1